MLLAKIYPYEYVKSVHDIDYQKLVSLGYKALIFDIDATLIPHGMDSTQEIDELFFYIHGLGLQTLLLSNNSTARIQKFVKNIPVPFIADAKKPETKSYFKALAILNTTNKNTIFIGDQLFTDILGANRCNMPSILVDYLVQPHETKIGKKRQLERLILKIYQYQTKYQHRLGGIEKQPQ